MFSRTFRDLFPRLFPLTSFPQLLLLILLLATPNTVQATAEDGAAKKPDRVIKVGTYPCPPFVIDSGDGIYRGLSIDLWQLMAEAYEVGFDIQVYELEPLLEAVEKQEVDIGVSCISITPEREERVDFSHSFYETHLAIAVKEQGLLDSIISLLTNEKILKVLMFVFLAASFVGGLYYLLEHKVNDKLYSMNSRWAKIVEGFILGLLFITKGPFNYYEFKTLTGRVITVLLAVATTFFIASITAILASTFTVGLMESDIRGPEDLRKRVTGAKEASTSSQYLADLNIVHRTFETNDEMLDALDRGTITAVVADDPVLKYMIKKGREEGKYERLAVLPYQFEKQNYGLLIGDNSEHLEALNRALLEIRRTKGWDQALKSYFAEGP